jgi:hypothetical protein
MILFRVVFGSISKVYTYLKCCGSNGCLNKVRKGVVLTQLVQEVGMNDSELGEWMDIPISRIEADVEKLKDELIRTGAYDSRSRVGDTLLRIQGQLNQIRQNLPKPR